MHIPAYVADGIVRNAIQSGEVRVRAVTRYQSVPQLLTKEEKTDLLRNWPISPYWELIEVNLSDLQTVGRQLIPNSLTAEARVLSGETKKASDAEINDAIAVAYTNAEAKGEKPPNIRELPRVAQGILEPRGLCATGNRIATLGNAFGSRRRKPGKTVHSEQHKK